MIRPVTLLVLAIMSLLLVSLVQGDYPVPLTELWQVLRGDPAVGAEIDMIVLDLRLPRAVLALLVGAALGVAGAITQAVMRNPLAEPGLLGINSGAALAAMIIIVGMNPAPDHLVPAASFAGAAAMTLAVYLLAWRNGTSSLRLILIGIGLSSLGGSATAFLSAFGDVRDVQRAMVWLAGSIYDASWAKVQTLLMWAGLPFALVWASARQLDTISFGDETARSLGQPVDRVRLMMIAACTLLSGAAVAVSGLIGFVGLIAPHLARRIVGRSHVRLVPAAALLGAVLVMAADLVGRTIIAPAQIPAGILTALLGAPFFAFLMWERRHVAA
ncbi:iron ABC transporter permease [Aquamicrobium sp. LC103]|uniref:FecCD family ABC transporter permease n=1 Tax=Aquamicrobium sp. LC103 TaxID=1120658 RepID=UPI00063ECBB4|nr:iron ABC transporter permease [Aquamicrobium sp. LC103]TKT78155.1 iron ABC transporter permease [Aquamicrobium sp. LC103]